MHQFFRKIGKVRTFTTPDFRPFFPDVSAAALRLWERHHDYLTPQHSLWSLVNSEFSDDVRLKLGNSLLKLLPQRILELMPPRVRYPGAAFTGDQF